MKPILRICGQLATRRWLNTAASAITKPDAPRLASSIYHPNTGPAVVAQAEFWRKRLTRKGRWRRRATLLEEEESAKEGQYPEEEEFHEEDKSSGEWRPPLFAAGDQVTIDARYLPKDRLRRKSLPALWLRDNCRCSSCVNQDTMQRNFNTFELPTTPRPKQIDYMEEGTRIIWEDGHESTYPWKFVRHYLRQDARKEVDVVQQCWGAEASQNPPSAVYSDVMRDDLGVADLTEKIRRYGFVFVNETPYEDPDDTKRLLERIAFIRITHYGGFYDFTPDMSMADTAYTNIALPAHTDTTYFTDPAGLQAFHLLSHKPAPGQDMSEAASGGKSLLVDGLKAKQILKREDRRAYEILSSVHLPWHASGNKGITISPYRRFPVLSEHQIRWNNDDRGVVPLNSGRLGQFTATDWYDAARKWDAILRRKDVECWLQLEPGKVLIFDNWRVLHGRSAFTGIRRICGAYINRDDFISRWKNLNLSRQIVLDSVMG